MISRTIASHRVLPCLVVRKNKVARSSRQRSSLIGSHQALQHGELLPKSEIFERQ